MKRNKVVLVGVGNVGSSFVYAALNQGLFSEIVITDINKDLAVGNVLDYEDANVVVPQSATTIKYGDFDECADADLVVITSGIAQKPGETRLELLGRNAKIMREIALNVKKSGFSGITIIASNPVDILGTIYQKYTGFDHHRVIPSGTLLDSSRLKGEVAKRLGVSPKSVTAFVIGEHGDSSVSVFSRIYIGSVKLDNYKKFTQAQKATIHKAVMTKAYTIINKKRATYYGIGACLTRLCRAVLFDENIVMPCAIKKGTTYIGWPTIINAEGTHGPIRISLSDEEKELFKKSSNILKSYYKHALESLNEEFSEEEVVEIEEIDVDDDTTAESEESEE